MARPTSSPPSIAPVPSPTPASPPASPGPAAAAAAPEQPVSVYLAPDGSVRRGLSVAEISRIVAEGGGTLWVDVDTTMRSHLALLENACRFHPLSVEDVLHPNSRVKVEEYPGYLFLVIRGVRFVEQTEDPYDLETVNLNFYLGANYLVTAHAGPSHAVAEVGERIARSPDLLQRGPDRLMHAMMDAAIDAYFPLLDRIDGFIDRLEERVFADFDQASLRDIFAVKRLVLQLRRHLMPQREVFNILTNRPTPLLRPDAQIYFRDVYDHILRINDSLEAFRDLLGSTLDSYLTQVSNRLGTVTKGLAVVATMSVPFVVISGMYGMNFQHIPLSNSPNGFWLMVLIQLVAGLALLGVLRLFKLL